MRVDGVRIDPRDVEALRLRFEACCARLASQPQPDLFEALRGAYAGCARHYHSLVHVATCLDHLDAAAAAAALEATQRDEVEIALWFHDAVYDPRRDDNELRSADWVSRTLVQAGADRDVAARVRNLVLATRHDAVPAGPDARLLVDIDLAVLGARADVFAAYDAAIRREYDFVPAGTYRTRRIEVLRRFLERPAIYATPYFTERCEAQARRNLIGAIERLQRERDEATP